MFKLVLIDDDAEVLAINQKYLTGAGFTVYTAISPREGILSIRKNLPDCILLDVMLPEADGYRVCRYIRSFSSVPILFLTARSSEEDVIRGLTCGGDDYLAKPFSYTELLGRTRALIRRYRIYQGKSPTAGQSASNLLICSDLCLDTRSEKVTLKGQPVTLTSTEYQILKLLLSNRRQIFSPQRLYEAIWEEPYYYGAGNTITVHIRNLRQKIEPDPSNPVYIKTTWGRGYHCD